jgi:hypothetical protein
MLIIVLKVLASAFSVELSFSLFKWFVEGASINECVDKIETFSVYGVNPAFLKFCCIYAVLEVSDIRC